MFHLVNFIAGMQLIVSNAHQRKAPFVVSGKFDAHRTDIVNINRRAMKKFLIIILFLPLFCFGQKQGNIWYFGDHAGLDFNSGSPVVINNGQVGLIDCSPFGTCHAEGSAIICDSSGALLFYCDGSTAWNKNHQIMLNGDSLLSTISSTQSSLIVPQPGSSRYFYLFTTDDFFAHNLQYGFRYSIIDICLDNGLGGIINGEKNLLLLDTVTEKLTGVRHANGVDYWIIVHKFHSDAFHCYRLSSTGIIDTVISHVGSVHPIEGANTWTAVGQLKASPNGQKLALVNGNATPAIAEYFDFDNNTGIVSNVVSIQTNPLWSYYGVSFSPDNSKLYIACNLNGNGVYQFDLSAGGGNPTAVVASKTLVAGTYNYLGLQLATDGKIYVARSPFVGNSYLGVISSPNNAGTSCNYVDAAIDLNGHAASYGFPNFIDSYDYSNTVSKCETGIAEQSDIEKLKVFPNPFSTQLTFSYADNEQAVVSLYNFLGQRVLQQTFTNYMSTNTEQLANGIYFYELRNDKVTVMKGKVLKQ